MLLAAVRGAESFALRLTFALELFLCSAASCAASSAASSVASSAAGFCDAFLAGVGVAVDGSFAGLAVLPLSELLELLELLSLLREGLLAPS